MGIYTRSDSRYYWMWLERPGRSALRKSTRVLVDAETPGQRRDQRLLADQIYRAAMGDLARRRHKLPDDERPTIGFVKYADWYQENYTAHKRSAARERSAIRNLKEFFRGRDLHDIDRALVVQWRTERRRVVTAPTVNRESDVLKHMLAQAVPKYLDSSPIAGLPRLRVRKALVRIFSESEERALFAAAKNLEEQAIMLIARDTLMRLSDVKTLQWAHYRGDFIAVVDPKTDPYPVPVTERLADVLEALRAEQRASSATGKEPKFIFPRRQRGPGSLSSNTIHRIFVEMCKRAGILQGRKRGGVTFHSLRHTGTTRALERGVPMRGVQGAGGWSSLRQLEERYGHLTDEMLRAFRDRAGGDKVPRPGGARDDEPGTVH
jgi:integrase